MATFELYQTTERLFSEINYDDPRWNNTISDLLRDQLYNFASINNNFVYEYYSGYSNYGIANDGAFYVETNSYVAFFYGNFGQTSSNIQQITYINKITGAQIDINGLINYNGLPFFGELLGGNLSKIVSNVNLGGPLFLRNQLDLSATLNSNGLISGAITTFTETNLNTATNLVDGVLISGTANFSTNVFNPTLTTIASGNITTYDVVFGEGYNIMTDRILASNINLAITTKLKDIVLNQGNDNYTLTGTLGINMNAGAGNDTVNGGIAGDTIAGGSGNDVINGGDGIDTVVLSGARANYNITKSGSEYIFTDLAPNRDGIDRISNAEYVEFADGTFALTDQFVNETSITKIHGNGIYSTAKGQTVASYYGLSVGEFVYNYIPLLASTNKNYAPPKGNLTLIAYETGEFGLINVKSAKSFTEQKFYSNGLANGKSIKLTLDQVFNKEKSYSIDLNGDGFIGDVVSQVVDGNGDANHPNIGLYKLISGRYAIGQTEGFVGDTITDSVVLMSTIKKAWVVKPTTTVLGISEMSSGDFEVLTQTGSSIKAQIFDDLTGLAVGKAISLKVENLESREYFYGIDLNGDSVISLVGQETPPIGW